MQQPFPEVSGEGCCLFPATFQWKMKPIFLLALLMTALLACSRATPTGEPVPVGDPENHVTQQPKIRTGTGPWTFSPVSTSHSYRSIEIVSLELQSPVSPQRDTFTTTTDFTLQMIRVPTHARVTGVIEHFTRTPPGDLEPDPSQELVFRFAGRIQSGGLVLDSIAGQIAGSYLRCETAGINRMTTVQRNIALLPSTLIRGQRWTDSSTVPACSGSIPIQLTTVREYHVLGEESSGSIALDRSDRIVASGEGAQGQHRISLRADGSGNSRMSLNPTDGSLSRAESEYRIEVVVGSSGRLQHFTQVVRESVTLR
jgi:hypothetical protein